MMSFTWNSYNGAVLQEKADSYFDHDVLKAHLVEFIQDNLGIVTLTENSKPTAVVCLGDYPIADNMVLPSCIVSIQTHEELNEYIGNFLFEDIDRGGDIAASGSYDMVYGSEKMYLVRADVWSDSPWMRDVVSGKLENLLQWHKSLESSELYTKGIKQVKVIGSDIIGYDQSDRYIKDVSYHTGNDMVYRRYVNIIIRADVRFVDPSGSGSTADNLLVGEVDLRAYQASGSTGAEVLEQSGTNIEFWSGTFSGS